MQTHETSETAKRAGQPEGAPATLATASGESNVESNVESNGKSKMESSGEVNVKADVERSAGASSDHELHRLPWEVSVAIDVAGGEAETLTSDQAEGFVAKPGMRVAVQGKSDRDAYVYLVVVAEPGLVVAVYPNDGGAIQAKAGEVTRLPPEPQWFTVPEAGKVHAISSPRPLSREEIAEEIDGRRPKTKPATIGTR